MIVWAGLAEPARADDPPPVGETAASDVATPDDAASSREEADPAAGDAVLDEEAFEQVDAPRTQREIESLTVTARRKEELLQEIPMSVTALSEKEMSALGARDLSDIATYAPNLRFDQGAASANSASVFIRGIGQTEGTINADPKVGIYLDGVYQARSLGTILSTWDVQRVEVIRGPQGTLFGKNAIGGAIQVITNPPVPRYEAAARFSVGDYSYLSSELMLNAPIDVFGLGDVLSARGSFQYEDREGYVYDVNLDQDFSSQRLIGGRVALRFNPTDELDIRLAYWNQAQPLKSVRGECQIKQEQNDSGTRFLDGVESARAIAAVGGDFAEECDRSKPLVSSTNVENRDDLNLSKIYGFVDWRSPEIPMLGMLDFDSTTAYQSLEQSFNFEADSTALPLLEAYIEDLGYWQFSQELQVSGGGFAERLNWTAGVFYLHESKAGPPDFVQGIQPDFEFTTDSGVYFPLGVTGEVASRFEHETVSGYIFGGYDVTEALSVTAGFRYGWEKKNLSRQTELQLCTYPDTSGDCSVIWTPDEDGVVVIGPYAINTVTDRFAEDSWGAPTGHAGAQYSLDDDLNVYAGFQLGYSSGGFNYLNADTDGAPQTFEPESLAGFELGFKSTWFERKLVFNAAYFWDYYKDKQVRTRVAESAGTDGLEIGVSDAILNAGDSVIQGAEIEISSSPIEGLLLSGGLGLQFNSYDNFEILDEDATRDATEAARVGLPDDEAREIFVYVYEDISDNAFPYMPQVNFNLLGQYSHAVTDGVELTGTIDYAWQSRIYFDPENTPELSQGPMGLLNLRLTARWDRTDTELSLWMKNVLDETYLTSGYSLGAYVSRYYGRPRMFGMTFTQRIGGN